jgi:demethoxyubiquinone hydroxylase (CLK1/Coq7/Cat5 family)
MRDSFEQELELLESMQESLLAHLLHLDQQTEKVSSKEPISREKLKSFSVDELKCSSQLKKEKIKLRKIRLTVSKHKVIV